ncbi:Rieske 2Fe-2S [Seminavis robusta]|uniref:Rieske 2Fe-2S n=1 Tax=Seminavis robusta TaxID=568900 RepID=A0A9N8HII7_9STRA|nr:Rieske 2Fe-2S [Seminavis robusta]|eukprot:Sro598_g172970.1 Rieske 2Fe-2S (516) ;mRNA; f:10679-12226
MKRRSMRIQPLSVILGLMLWDPSPGLGFLPHQFLPNQRHQKPAPQSLQIWSHQFQPAATVTRNTHLLAQKKDQGEDDENDGKDNDKGGGFLRNLQFWSSKEEDDESDKKKESKGKDDEKGLFRFLGGKDKDKKSDKDKRQKDKEEGGGIFRAISKRFNAGNETTTPEPEETTTIDLDYLDIDTRPTFVTFQRSKAQDVRTPKPGSRTMPVVVSRSQQQPKKKPIKSLSPPTLPPTGSTRKVSTQSAKKSAPPSPKKTTTPPKPNKTRRISPRSKSKDDEGNKENGDTDDSESLGGRFQRIFSSSDNDDNDAKTGNKTKSSRSRAPRSVAQKFVSNLLSDNNKKEQWVPVFPKTRLSPGEIVPVEVAGLDLIIVASKDAQNIYCMVNSCPHLGTPLETGFLDRRPIELDKEAGGFTSNSALPLQETDVTAMLSSDGCEDCIVCPLHKTAFALQSGQVRGEWCPYPPVLGKMMSTVKNANSAAVFDVRTRGKNIEVRLNSPLTAIDDKKEGGGQKKS